MDLLAIFCKGTFPFEEQPTHTAWLKPTIPLNHPTLCPPRGQQYCNFVSQVVIRAHYQLIFWKLQKVLAERGFDPRTSGLWAQHASTAPLCFAEGHSTVWPYVSWIWLMQYTTLWLWYSSWFKLPIHGLVWVKSKFDVNFSTQASCVHLQSSGPPVQFSSFSCSFRRNSAK